MIGIVAEETAMCSCNSAIKIQISNREDQHLVKMLMQTWAQSHEACYENVMNVEPV